jgi:hypothetical protein
MRNGRSHFLRGMRSAGLSIALLRCRAIGADAQPAPPLQKKHQDILGSLAPDLARSTPRPGAAPVWSRVRVAAGNRLFAEALCSRLRAAGESCLVQRN